MKTLKVIVLFSVVLGFSACKKTRADYRDDITDAVCKELRKCDGIGEGKKYRNMDDCRTEVGAEYNRRWDAESCEGKINDAKFQECKTKARANACDGNILDGIGFAIQCGAGDVCVPDAQAK